MIVLVFFGVVIGFSLTLCAIDKVKTYRKEEKSVWIDIDAVVVNRDRDNKNLDLVMTRVM